MYPPVCSEVIFKMASSKRVAYFYDPDVGNFHYGELLGFIQISLLFPIRAQRSAFMGLHIDSILATQMSAKSAEVNLLFSRIVLH